MRYILFLLLSFTLSGLLAQNQIISFTGDNPSSNDLWPQREVSDDGVQGITVNYQFFGAHVVPIYESGTVFQKLFIDGFSHSQEVGKASLPSHIDLILVPDGVSPVLQLISCDTILLNNFTIFPALEPASDEYGAVEPEFVIDSSFYNSPYFYPSSPVQLRELIHFKGFSLALVEIFPIQYLPGSRKIYAHSNIVYKVSFPGAATFMGGINNLSDRAKKLIPNYVINDQSVRAEMQSFSGINTNIYQKDYLIITHPDYAVAADSLANWKRQLGFNPEIFVSANWTSSTIKTTIQNFYTNNTPSPDYFVIIGDNDKVPGQTITSGTTSFASDLYYACMDGSGDYVPDMAYGRISVANPTQALLVVQKIINYERNPLIDTSFYNNGLNCAYFQHAGNGYAERRFAQTSEDIRNHVVSHGYNVDRVYYTESNVNPLYWNNGYYSAGESLPNYLKKPTFPWNGNAAQITNLINEGRFYVFHRDHGMSSGWGDPYYTTSNINSLNNGNKLPVVFSINCLTGKYQDAECFAEKFLRHPNGGAVGVFGHGEVSYSGYNDGLSLGLADAIWASPGLIPNFTGSGGVTNPILTSHTNIYRLGDVKNQGLIRMIETWGGSTTDIKYTHELFNYFGDPAMEIYTDNPIPILASVPDTISCINDSSLVISNSNFDGLATLVVDDILVAKTSIINGAGILSFNSISGSYATLTISGHNKVPFIKKIVIIGGCPRAKFSVYSQKYCLQDSVVVTDMSTGNIVSRLWNFGAGASPATSTGNGPFTVYYSTPGAKTISLTVTDSNSVSVSYYEDITMDQYCRYTVPATGTSIISKCSGMLYDDGGIGNYSDNTSGTVTISPNGASSITLTFSQFDFESGYDYLRIYDGASTNSPLIGSYTGTVLPNNGQISSTGGSITIQQFTDSYLNQGGFELSWQCSYPNSAPSCDFSISDSASCNGIVQFFDNSINGPTSWSWDFGDGNGSSLKNPQHIYSQSGTYNVKLIVSNAFGVDSIIQFSIVSVNLPPVPMVTDNIRCKSGVLNISSDYSGNGTLWWFGDATNNQPLDTGKVFQTPFLSQSTTYYAEVHEDKLPLFTGKPNNTGGGGYFTSASVHYLVFDSYKDIRLKSVKVYASSAGDRTIQLLNSTGSLIMSRTIFIPTGESRVELNMDIPVGMNLRLAGPATPNLYRNNAGISYPYLIDGVVNIKHSSASTDPTGYYYYFYDWEIVDGDCMSPRFAVPVIISDSLSPIANFDYSNNDPYIAFDNQSLYGDSYYWDFGDGDFSILENPNHLFQNNGTFTVSLTVTNNCGQRYFSKQITILNAGLQTTKEIQKFVVYPIPAKDKLFIDISVLSSQSLTFQISDMVGKIVERSEIDVIAGQNQLSLRVKNLANGMYTLTFIAKDGLIVRKFIVE